MKAFQPKTGTPKNFHVILPVVMALALAFPACGYLGKFKSAQDYFNVAAQADNQTKFSPAVGRDAENELVLASQINSNYAVAHKLLIELTASKRNDLHADGLLGNALTMQALCEWKLGKYDQAIATAGDAIKEAKDQLFPRDHALLTALPGLIKADQAYWHSQTGSKNYSEIEAMIVGEQGAKKDLDAAMQLVDDKHPVRMYLLMSELAALRTLQVAIEKKISEPETAKQARRELQETYVMPTLELFKSALAPLNETQRTPILSYWQTLLGTE